MRKLDVSFFILNLSLSHLYLQLLHSRSMQLFMNSIIYIKLTSFEIKLNFHFRRLKEKIFLSQKWPLPNKHIKMFEQVTFIFMYNVRKCCAGCLFELNAK